MRFVFAIALLFSLAASLHAADAPADTSDQKKLDPAHLKQLTDAIGGAGVTKGRVFTLTLPRADLEVQNNDFGDIPVEAGIATTLHLFRCGCGKYFLIGQFCVADYESNDVLDSLVRGHFSIASIAPMLLQDKPRIMLIRFQGEGQMDDLVKVLADAFRWIGENRTKTNPIK